MNKWKRRGKSILVFLLILGLTGTMADYSQITAAAADAAAESDIPGENAAAKETSDGKDGTEEETKKPEAEKPAEPEEAKESEAENPAEPEESKEPAAEKPAEPEETNDPVPTQNTPAVSGSTGTGQPGGSAAAEAEKPLDAQTKTDTAFVEELLKGLPSLEELKSFNKEQEAAVLEQLQAAMDAYENLDEEQRAQLPGADAQLKELIDYFTEPAAPAAATAQDIQSARNAMTAAMKGWQAEVDLSGFNLTSVEWADIWPDVAQDNPDLFYVIGSKYFTESTGVITKCEFTYSTSYTKDSVQQYEAAIDRVFAEVIDGNGSMTDEQKATALHDYLVQHMVYDQNANNNLGIEKRNAYEALVNGIGVCQGYTLAYAALLKKAGIETGYCKSESMNHIWNYVKLDGNWYHADLTYDDATAASQTGETGYVKHTYFLLSDDAMRNASHAWEDNGITCSNTGYDNSWHKTAPITESAIYAVGGDSYYLKKKTVSNNPNICSGAVLIKRESSGTETEVAGFEIENLGNGWPLYEMSFSRLSCSKGVLYFNVGNSVYAYNPSEGTGPAVIYRYTGSDGRIVTGLLADGNKMTLELLNPDTSKIEKIKIALAQEEQKNFAFPEKSKTVTYGDAAFTMAAQGAETGSSVRYSSSDPSVAAIDPATGRVTVQKAGSTEITATASETEEYLAAESTCRLTVSPKALSWDVSALKAGDRLDQITGARATLYGELKLTGILEKDKESVRFECPADRLTGIYETVAEGSRKVKLSWKSAQNTAVLQGEGSKNYTMPANLPDIQGNIRTEDETIFRTEVENGISKVPDSFKNKEHLNTPEKIEKEIKLKLQGKFSEIKAANIAVYDVELLININGFGWEKATKDNFPAQGLLITLPYPSGTGKNTHNFAVTHMFTEDMNGYRAGEVEHPAVTKTDDGIRFKVYGLSPIAVGWQEVKSGSSQGGGSSSSANTVKSPRTGDISPVMLYVLLLTAASGTLIALSFKTKKNRQS